MTPRTMLKTALTCLVTLIAMASVRAAEGQVVDKLGFSAQTRPINYATPLAPAGGTAGVIVYSKGVAHAQAAAQKLRKAIEAWSGKRLELLDDRAVTGEDTWLLTDAFKRTPMVVIGNGQENRVIHALATRYLAQSNRSFPGGDRYLIRTMFEPFVADVNMVVIEASTEAGAAAAEAKFEDLLQAFPKDAAATIPHTRVIGFVKDKWDISRALWKPLPEFTGLLDRGVTEIAKAYKGPPITAGDSLAKAGATADLYYWLVGGIAGQEGGGAYDRPLEPGIIRGLGAMYLNACRAAGDRTHMPWDHYGAMSSVVGIRALLQSGLLSAQEVNEFENFMTLSGAYPNEYYYDHICSDSGWTNETGNRHSCACMMVLAHTLDYVANHCRMNEKTRREIHRRLEGTRKTLSRYVESFRDNVESAELGESTMMMFYAMLHQGMTDWIANGNLKHAADMYLATSDNIVIPNQWHIPMCYAGTDSYIGAGPGSMYGYFNGRGLVNAAALYYDDPQYRWFIKNDRGIGGEHGSVACNPWCLHWDTAGPVASPTRYNGFFAVPFDKRLYKLYTHRSTDNRWAITSPGLVPGPFEKCVDRVALRDGVTPDDAYVHLATTQGDTGPYQNNSLARYTDLGEIWLFHNTLKNSSFARNKVSISNGTSYRPRNGCTLEALANLGDMSLVSTKESDVAGSHYTRTVAHWKGHYLAVLDRVEALADADFNLICRWRTPQPAALNGGAPTGSPGLVYVASASSGSAMRIQNTEPLLQTAEVWEADGNVLSQFKSLHLAKGQSETFQNLLYVAGPKRPDEFQARRLSAGVMLIKGKTAGGECLAMIGADTPLPLAGFQTDATAFIVSGDTLYLANATSLKLAGSAQPLLASAKRVNYMIEFKVGTRVIDTIPDTVGGPSERILTSAVLVTPPTKPSEDLARLWAQAPEPAAAAPAAQDLNAQAFQSVAADHPLQRPQARVYGFAVTSNVPSWQPLAQLTDGQYGPALPGYTPTWPSTDNLEITLTFAQPTDISCLRLVSILKMVPAYGFGCEGYGTKHYRKDDMKFSLVLSDDGFQKDVRKIDSPKIDWEETPYYPTIHSGLGRLPTWRIAVEGKARQVKLVPRATTKERASLYVVELEAYAPRASDELTASAFAADLDGDGSNELVLGTSNKELAAYDDSGKRLWSKPLADHVFSMNCADLDGNGKSQALVYTTDEHLHRVNADGAERPEGDVFTAEMTSEKRDTMGGVLAIAAWKPDKDASQHVMLWSEACFEVWPDGAVKIVKLPMSRGAGRLVNLVPGEPEVLATVLAYSNVMLWSARRDANGEFVQLGNHPMAGSSGAPFMRGLGWAQGVNRDGLRGVVAAHEGGMSYCPIYAFQTPTGKPLAPPPADPASGRDKPWELSTGAVPALAALLEDADPKAPIKAFLAKEDGFVSVIDVSTGQQLAALNARGPVLGLALLGEPGTPRRVVVGSKFGLSVFDAQFRKTASLTIPSVAFAGPGGKAKDKVYLIDAAGKVTVVTIH